MEARDFPKISFHDLRYAAPSLVGLVQIKVWKFVLGNASIP